MMNMSKFYIKQNMVIDHPAEILKKENLNNYALQVAKEGNKTNNAQNPQQQGYQGNLVRRPQEEGELRQDGLQKQNSASSEKSAHEEQKMDG